MTPRRSAGLSPRKTLTTIGAIARAEVVNAFAGLPVVISDRHDATYRVRVVEGLTNPMFRSDIEMPASPARSRALAARAPSASASSPGTPSATRRQARPRHGHRGHRPRHRPVRRARVRAPTPADRADSRPRPPELRVRLGSPARAGPTATCTGTSRGRCWCVGYGLTSVTAPDLPEAPPATRRSFAR